MKIYTKGGDRGETGLFGGTRVPKDDLRICAYGTLDELNSCLGMVLALLETDPRLSEMRQPLLEIQNELFQLGAELATPRGKKISIALVDVAATKRLEAWIDSMESRLSPLKTFILPGGSTVAAQMHLVRTVSRRAEREIIRLNRSEPLRTEVLEYVNRLSDTFFVAARLLNHLIGVADVPWEQK